jgi:thiol-disulfide isomerase/thioredoxin
MSSIENENEPLNEVGGRKKHPKKNKIIVGKVYANWCSACNGLKPEWEKFEKMMKSNNVEVMNIEEKEMGPRLKQIKNTHGFELKVEGYPTLFKIADGKLSYYEKERNANKMKEWALHGGSDEQKQNGIPNVMYDLQGGKRKNTRKNRRDKKKSRKTRGFWGLFFG